MYRRHSFQQTRKTWEGGIEIYSPELRLPSEGASERRAPLEENARFSGKPVTDLTNTTSAPLAPGVAGR